MSSDFCHLLLALLAPTILVHLVTILSEPSTGTSPNSPSPTTNDTIQPLSGDAVSKRVSFLDVIDTGAAIIGRATKRRCFSLACTSYTSLQVFLAPDSGCAKSMEIVGRVPVSTAYMSSMLGVLPNGGPHLVPSAQVTETDLLVGFRALASGEECTARSKRNMPPACSASRPRWTIVNLGS
jgi:hypothetical protein